MKKITALLLIFLTVITLIACDNRNTPAETTESTPDVTTEAAPVLFKYIEDGKEQASVVISKNMQWSIRKELNLYIDELAETYKDADLEPVKDDDKSTLPEILIGRTNREGSNEFYETIPVGKYVIEVTENKVRIGADRDDLLVEAIKYFGDNYLVPAADGSISFEVGRYESEEDIRSLEGFFNKTDKFVTKSTHMGNVRAIDGRRVMQGGCTDGRYFYAAMINSGHSIGEQEFCYIHKIDLETFTTVKISEAIPSDHSNDLTYIPATNEIYINHCYEHTSRNTIIDADTLEYKGYVDFTMGHNSISFSPSKEVFVVGTKSSFWIFDRVTKRVPVGFKPVYSAHPTTYTSQGSCVDDHYIYFSFYNKNVIKVYDWSGEYITDIEIDIKGEEPENISIVGNTLYIACNNSNWTGGTIYKCEIVKK